MRRRRKRYAGYRLALQMFTTESFTTDKSEPSEKICSESPEFEKQWEQARGLEDRLCRGIATGIALGELHRSRKWRAAHCDLWNAKGEA